MENKDQIELLKKKFKKLRKEIDAALDLIESDPEMNHQNRNELKRTAEEIGSSVELDDEEIIEGIFDGEKMIGPDGKEYSVPENYASKSKLVEGDVLKLTIKENGKFIYKQIGPKSRKRLRGTLMKDDDTKDFYVIAEGKIYQVLLASVTYYKGEVGDDVIIVVPQSQKSRWAAIENIIKKAPGKTSDEAVDDAIEGNGLEVEEDERIDTDYLSL